MPATHRAISHSFSEPYKHSIYLSATLSRPLYAAVRNPQRKRRAAASHLHLTPTATAGHPEWEWGLVKQITEEKEQRGGKKLSKPYSVFQQRQKHSMRERERKSPLQFCKYCTNQINAWTHTHTPCSLGEDSWQLFPPRCMFRWEWDVLTVRRVYVIYCSSKWEVECMTPRALMTCALMEAWVCIRADIMTRTTGGKKGAASDKYSVLTVSADGRVH